MGIEPAEDMKQCANCGSQIPIGGVVCPFCLKDPNLRGSEPMAFGGGIPKPSSGPMPDDEPLDCSGMIFLAIAVLVVIWFLHHCMAAAQ